MFVLQSGVSCFLGPIDVSNGQNNDVRCFVSSIQHLLLMFKIGPMWIVTFILAFTDFCFVLDASRNWEEGLEGYPYMRKYFSRIRSAEWVLLVFVTAITFSSSLGWVLAEIFRENKTNKMNTKSDQE